MAVTVLIVLAGLLGAGGVVLAAAAAHAAPGTGLDSAAHMLLFHAAALLAGTAVVQTAAVWRPLALVALFGFAAGAALFAGDLSLRAFAGHRLFPMAAPTGGTILIVAWLLLAVAALIGLRAG